MFFHHRLNGLVAGASLAALLVMTGCAQQPTTPESTGATPAQGSIVSGKAEPSPAPVPTETKPDYASINPVPITFEKMSVKLSDAEKAVIGQVAERAKKATKLLVTGYCDRKQVGNPKAAALARATAVKDELVKLGIKPKAVRIKYVTTVADKHAAEIAF
ncbi:OmpA family protein [Noviherbaspirillum sp.]|uniref:OmpA family protein n=1 Tax=Noviherbaspirillum sp. TaxID=1926288 RepID=UPI002FDF5870